MLERFVLLSSAVGYLLHLFEAQERTSHFGPFRSFDDKIIRHYYNDEGEVEDTYEQPVTLIERIRRWSPLNPYNVNSAAREWHVDSLKIEVWECPKCLSPWIALAVVVPFMLLAGKWKQIPLMWLAVTGGGYAMYGLIETLRGAGEGAIMAYSAETPDGFDDQPS